MRRRRKLRFGAELVPLGVRFRLWAPKAASKRDRAGCAAVRLPNY